VAARIDAVAVMPAQLIGFSFRRRGLILARKGLGKRHHAVRLSSKGGIMGAIKVGFICQKSLSGTLTCAQVLDLMMDQPTADETSHAQLHTADGFRIDPAKIVVNVLGLPIDTLKQQKQTEWGSYDSHLHPAGVPSPVERFAPSDYLKKGAQERTSKVMQDQTRIALTNQ